MGKLSIINGLGLVGQSEQSITDEIRQRTEMAKPRPYIHFSKLNSADATKSLLIDHYNASKAIQPENKNLYNKALTAIYKWNPADKAVSGIGVMPDELQGLGEFLAKVSQKAHLPALNRKVPKVGAMSLSGYDTNFSPQIYCSFADSSLFKTQTYHAMTADAQIFLAQHKSAGVAQAANIDPNSGIALGKDGTYNGTATGGFSKGSATDQTNNKLNLLNQLIQTGTATGNRRIDRFLSLEFSVNQSPSCYQEDGLYPRGAMFSRRTLNSLFGQHIKAVCKNDRLSQAVINALETKYPGPFATNTGLTLNDEVMKALEAICNNQFYLNMANEQPKYRVSGFQAYERMIEAMNLAGVFYEHAFAGGQATDKQADKWLIKSGQMTNFEEYLHMPIYEKYANETLTKEVSTSLGLYGFIESSKHPFENRNLNGNDLTTATALKMQAQTSFIGGMSSFTGLDQTNLYLMNKTGIMRTTANDPKDVISAVYRISNPKVGEPVSATVGTVAVIIAICGVIKAVAPGIIAMITNAKQEARGINPTSVPPALLGLNPATSAAKPEEDFGYRNSSGGSNNGSSSSNPLKDSNPLIFGAGAALIGLLLLNNK